MQHARLEMIGNITMSHRIDELTGLRCAAVMMVVIAHAQHMIVGGYGGFLSPLRLFANGDLGVVIFFVLSGFLITNLLQAEWNRTGSIDLLRFYTKRILRIWPAFYAYLIVAGVLALAGMIDIGFRQMAYAALHVWNYSEVLGLGPANAAHPAGAWYLGHFWTLALEEQFYWFWPPVLVFILARANTRLLPGLILIVPLIRMGSYVLMPALRGQLEMMFHTGIDPILIGCYAALNKDWIVEKLDALSNRSLTLTVLVLVLFFVFPVLENRLGGYWSASYGRTIEAGIAGLLIVSLTVKRRFWFASLLRTRVFVFVGNISFSLYLWQQLFTHADSPVALRFPFCIVQAIVVATLSYWLIEQPFLRLKDRLGKARIRGALKAAASPIEPMA
jgi:peptidoglycan/LPS O-acetylase OafA/YrhL